MKLFTDRYTYLTCEDNVRDFCNKHEVKYVDPKVTGSGSRQVVERTVTAAANAMDTENITDSDASACNLDPDAAVFTLV